MNKPVSRVSQPEYLEWAVWHWPWWRWSVVCVVMIAAYSQTAGPLHYILNTEGSWLPGWIRMLAECYLASAFWCAKLFGLMP